MGQRVIPCAITAEYVAGDGVTLGAAGSHNSVVIEYDFRSAGPQWEPPEGGTLIKYVLWTNPQGNTTNRVDLGVDKLVAGYDGKLYHASPTADAMCVAGWAEMVVVGAVVTNGVETVKIKTEPSRFRVLPGSNNAADNEGVAATVADQLQAEIETVDGRKVSKPLSPLDPDGEDGQFLVSRGDGATEWVDMDRDMVEKIMEEHREWMLAIPDDSLTTKKYRDGSVTEPKLADDAVTMNKLAQTVRQTVQSSSDRLDSTEERLTTAEGRLAIAEGDIINLEVADADIRQRQTSPYNFKGSCTYANLPASADINDTWYVTDRTYRMTWTGSAWQQSSMSEDDYTDELGDIANALIPSTSNLAESIPSDADLNAYMTPGSYRANSTEVVATLSNCPTTQPFRLIVIETTPSRIIQIVLANVQATTILFLRFYNSSSWGTWQSMATKEDTDQMLEQSMFTSAAFLSTIENGTDYDEITTPGGYQCRTAAAAQSMLHCPVTYGHRLYVVIPYTNATVKFQVVVCSTSNGVRLYFRNISSATKGTWHNILDTRDMNPQKVLFIDQEQLTTIENGTDYNEITTPGGYQCRNSASAKTMRNCPVKAAHRLYVTNLYSGSSYVFQVVVGSSMDMKMYVRRKKWKGEIAWSDWTQPANSGQYTPVWNEYNNSFALNVSRIKVGGVATYETLPVDTGEVDAEGYYRKDDEIGGVLYSSVWRDGLDVYRNLTLETYYSALANPASVLYTKNYTGKHIHNAHAWYGGVCSTYVTKIMGFPTFKTTSLIDGNARIEAYLQEKYMPTIRSIALGDVLLRQGHIAFVSQVYVDEDGALAAVGISEQVSPIFSTTVVTLGNLQTYLDERGYKVMVPTQAYEQPELDDPTFNANVIFERGNNTYITIDEVETDGAWFYIPDADSVIISKDLGAWNEVALSGVDSEEVNDVTVYNLSGHLSGVGMYDIKTDEAEGKACCVKVIDVGSATLTSAGVLTLKNWEGCRPHAYYIVREIPNEVETEVENEDEDEPVYNTAMDPTDGYHCSWTGDAGVITVPADYVPGTDLAIHIPVDYFSDLDRWKVWLEYETGSGLKQAFSNLITGS